jgi:PST family polysaccharide transporter
VVVSEDEQSDLTAHATDADAAEADDLGRMVAQGLRWSLVSNLTARVGTVLMGIVLARLLAPSEYGVYTVAFVALIVLSNVNDLGIETALVRHPGNVDDVGRTAVTVVGGSSLVLFVAAFIGAPAFADAFNAPDATGVIRLLTVCVLINGAFAMQSALLTREFQQARRAIADLTGLGVSIGVTVVLAWMGYGPWSLAWGRVIGNFVNGLLHFVLARARYRPGYDPDIARSLLKVGVPIAGASLFAEAVNDVDYVIVSRVLGATSLGLYLMAFNLSSWPVSTLSTSVTRVSVPGFARLQANRAAVQAAFARSLALLVGVSAFLCALLGVLSLPLVRFVYGPPWAGAALALRFLVVLGTVRVALQLGRDLLNALGRGRATLVIQVMWLAALAPALAIGATHDGIRGVGIAHMLVAVSIPVPGMLIALHRAGFSLRAIVAQLPRPLLGASAAAAAAYGTSWLVSGDFLRLLVGGTTALAVEAAVAGPFLWRLARSQRPLAPEPLAIPSDGRPSLAPDQPPL